MIFYISGEAEEFLPELEDSEAWSEIHLASREDRQSRLMAWNRGGGEDRVEREENITTYDRELVKPGPSTAHSEEDTSSGGVAMALMVTPPHCPH